MANILLTFDIKSDVNWLPRSVCILSGIPKRQWNLNSSSATSSAVMVFSGIASGNLVAISTILRIYLYPLVDLGSIGPAISTLIDRNGSPTSGRCPNGALVSPCRPSPSEHKSQLLTCLLTSFNIDGQYKTALIFSCVFFIPWCADIRDSCAMCRTLLLSLSGTIGCNLTPSFNASLNLR